MRSESGSPLLQIEDLVVDFDLGRGRTAHAVSGVSLTVRRGETLGLVGESGCGKSTLGRAVVHLRAPTSGHITFDSRRLADLSRSELRAVRSRLQMIFQDPISSLNPRRRVEDIVAEPLAIWKAGTSDEIRQRARELLEQVGIDPDVAGRKRPRELSGGQCQRVSIARALAMEPELIVCDEPVSALDVSVQAQVLNLLEDLKQSHHLTLLFVSHDLAVVKNISDRIAVMYLGRIAELAPSQELYDRPRHPYTAGLLDSVPDPDRGDAAGPGPVRGELPSNLDPPSGCRFRTRCPKARSLCSEVVPELTELAPEHYVACHFPLGDENDASRAAPVAITPGEQGPV